MNKHPPIAPEAMTTRSDLCFFIGFDSPTRCFSDVGPKLSLVGWFLLVGGGGVVVVVMVVVVMVVVAPCEYGGGPPLPAPLLLHQGVIAVQAEQAAHLQVASTF